MGKFKGVSAESTGSETTISKLVKPIKDIQVGEVMSDIDYEKYSEKYNFYGMTIKPCSTLYKKQCQNEPQHLTDLALNLAQINKFAVNELHYEFTEEKKNGRYPHIHCTIIKKGSLMKFYQKGYSIYIEPIYNYKKWVNYCKKEDQDNTDDYMFL